MSISDMDQSKAEDNKKTKKKEEKRGKSVWSLRDFKPGVWTK